MLFIGFIYLCILKEMTANIAKSAVEIAKKEAAKAAVDRYVAVSFSIAY